MSAKRDDDSDRTLTERCLEWCFLIWFPMEHLGDPGAETDIKWDGQDWRLPWGGSFKKAAEHMAGHAIRDAKLEAERKKARLPDNSESIPQMHHLSLREETLKRLCFELHDYHDDPDRSPLTGPSRIRFYTFYSVLCEIGRQPFNVAITVGCLLYGLRYDRLRYIFDGQLTPDPGQANRWWRFRRMEVEKTFSTGWGWEWLGRRCMEKAPDDAAEHMKVVLKAFEEDLSCSGAHEDDFRAAYKRVLESPEVIEQVNKKAGGTDKERLHRRDHKIERVAEHLVVCPVCGGLPRLLKEKQKGTPVPEVVLHLPVKFLGQDEKDDGP
jgi:hypothetical protein